MGAVVVDCSAWQKVEKNEIKKQTRNIKPGISRSQTMKGVVT